MGRLKLHRIEKSPSENSDRRAAILKAAIDEFAEKGFSGARTETIAQAAGVNKAMLHYYFVDKETLYAEVLEKLFGSIPDEKIISEKIANSNLNSIQYVRLFMKIVIAKHSHPESRPFRRIMAWELAEGSRNLKKVAQKYMVPRIQMLAGMISRGVENGELCCENPILAVHAMIAQIAFYYFHRETYEGSSIYHDLYEKVDAEKILELTVQQFIRCYVVKPDLDSNLPSEFEAIAEDLIHSLRQNIARSA